MKKFSLYPEGYKEKPLETFVTFPHAFWRDDSGSNQNGLLEYRKTEGEGSRGSKTPPEVVMVVQVKKNGGLNYSHEYCEWRAVHVLRDT